MGLINLRVVQLDPQSGSDRSRMVKFPFKLYKGDRYWVPQLIGDRKKFLDPAHNPSFEYLKVAYFVAEAVVTSDKPHQGGMPAGGMEQDVGTIAAIVNPRHNELYHDHVGFFGLFETINSQEVVDALFQAAGAWLAQQGCSSIRGPITFTISDEVGLLVDGFDDAPRVMMTYNPPYYPELLEAAGLDGVMDLYAYHFDLIEQYGSVEGFPPKLKRVVEKLKDRSKATIRKIDMKHFDDEVQKIKVVYRGAWEANWGEVPITDNEIEYIAKQLKQVLDPDLVYLAEIDGKPVGVGLTVPDANFVLKKMGGHLFPFGLIQALRYQKKIEWIRVLILGVLPEYRHLGIDAVMYYETAAEALRKGFRHIEGSWILANNVEMNRVIQNLGGKVYKTYRLYEKEL